MFRWGGSMCLVFPNILPTVQNFINSENRMPRLCYSVNSSKKVHNYTNRTKRNTEVTLFLVQQIIGALHCGI